MLLRQRLMRSRLDAATLAALVRPAEHRMTPEDARLVVAAADAAGDAAEGGCGGLRVGLWANLGRSMARNNRAVGLDR